METLSLEVLGRSVKVRCEDAEVRALLTANYGSMAGGLQTPDLKYTVGRQKASSDFFITREGQVPLRASNDGEFLFLFEKDMAIELQKLRCDLYFVHAAVLEFSGEALMLVAASGGGKSITTWGLLHHGFRYLSDELGPVDLKRLEVYPYPRALCLKDEPPRSYPLPRNTLHTSRTLHIPIEALPSGGDKGPMPLVAIFFLTYGRKALGPAVQSTSRAEAVTRLFVNALNPLAHPEAGLDGAVEIAKKSSCFELFTAELSLTCSLVKATLERLAHVRLGSSHRIPNGSPVNPSEGLA